MLTFAEFWGVTGGFREGRRDFWKIRRQRAETYKEEENVRACKMGNFTSLTKSYTARS